jgi:hypothetical protein
MRMKIAVDFDGTCVTHDFPKIGKDIGAIPVLKKITDNGHCLILFTMRSDGQKLGNVLTDAVNWFKTNNIPLYSVQFDINQNLWTDSNKCYAELYIDDAALGCPLIYPKNERPYVDWIAIDKILTERNII